MDNDQQILSERVDRQLSEDCWNEVFVRMASLGKLNKRQCKAILWADDMIKAYQIMKERELSRSETYGE